MMNISDVIVRVKISQLKEEELEEQRMNWSEMKDILKVIKSWYTHIARGKEHSGKAT